MQCESSAIGPAGAEDAPNVGKDDIPGDEEDENDNEGVKSITNGRVSKYTRNDNCGEKYSVMPDGNQVMIRTIPPDIGKLKLKAVRLTPLVMLLNGTHISIFISCFRPAGAFSDSCTWL